MNQEELDIIEQKRTVSRMSGREAFMRKLVLEGRVLVLDVPEFRQFSTLLGRCTGFGVLSIILCVAAASLVVALNWTPINYETLFGMQGRYWLPVLPLALLLVKGNRSVCARRDLSRGAALAVTACTLLTLLQGYSLYASWQPVS